MPSPTRQGRARLVPELTEGLPRSVMPRVESLPAGSWTAVHSHPWAQLSYAVRGVLQVRSAGGWFLAPPHRAIWVPAHLLHEVHTSEAAEMRSLYLRTEALLATPLATMTDCSVLDVSPLVRELILTVCAQATNYDERGPAGRLVQVLIDQLADLPRAAIDLPLPDDARLRRLCEALLAQPGDRRTLAQWGQEIGLTERSLVRLFQQQTGLSVGDWRRRLRLLSALEALQSGVKVAHVAQQCGYASPSAFIAAFQGAFGITPRKMFP